MTAEEKLAALKHLFRDAIEEYKEVKVEVEDRDYLDGYMASWVYSYSGLLTGLFEVLADE